MYQQVSYNAAGVLSHMTSDGVDGWTISEPKREVVLSRIVNAIDRWDLESKRNINYRYVIESHALCAHSSVHFGYLDHLSLFFACWTWITHPNANIGLFGLWLIWPVFTVSYSNWYLKIFYYFWSNSRINLFTAEKYCRLLKEEHGFAYLEALLKRTTNDKIRRFAKIALEGSVQFLENGVALGETSSDELEGWITGHSSTKRTFLNLYYCLGIVS